MKFIIIETSKLQIQIMKRSKELSIHTNNLLPHNVKRLTFITIMIAAGILLPYV